MKKVFLVAAGPDFVRGKVLRNDCATHDVCPTVLTLFGQSTPRMVGGRTIGGLFA